ncbi:MAG: hypothetical protein WCG26_01080 [Chloroflexales bacterium]
MAISAYTDPTYRAYLFGNLSITLQGILGWANADAPPLAEIVNDTLLVLGASDVATFVATGEIARLRAVGRYMLWRACLHYLVTQYDVSIDGNSFTRSQLIANLKTLLDYAYRDAIGAGVTAETLPDLIGHQMPAASVGTVVYDDPYTAPGSIYGVRRTNGW